MAVRREHKSGDLDKRLKLLNQQLYGKDRTLDNKSSKVLDNPNSSYKLPEPSSSFKNPASDSDITYLKHDLLKISILGALAFGAQFALYFATINHYIKLSF